MDVNGSNEVEENYSSRSIDIERIKAAKKRRIIQLKKWSQYDKMKDKEEYYRYKKGYPSIKRNIKFVKFNQNLVLIEAGNRGDIDEVRRLLSEGVCADAANDDGLTALHQAAINNNNELCRVLIQHKSNVNSRDKELWTPLHAAAICGHKEICALLIKNGADLMALNADGNMPYDICEDDETLDEIETAMANQSITQSQINDARLKPERRMLADLRDCIGRFGQAESVRIFSQLDKQGANMLHISATSGYGEVTKFLVEQVGVPVNILDKDGWQPIHIAALYGHMDVVEVLVANGADLDAHTQFGDETVYELVYDEEVYDQLLMLKRELERLKSARNNKIQQSHVHSQYPSNVGGIGLGGNGSLTSSFGLVRRRSSSNPRSASIRRSSMKEKSNLSWKEARQEAEIRRSLERKDTDEKPDGISQTNINNHVMINGKGSPSNHSRLKPSVISESITEYDSSDKDEVSVSNIKVDILDHPQHHPQHQHQHPPKSIENNTSRSNNSRPPSSMPKPKPPAMVTGGGDHHTGSADIKVSTLSSKKGRKVPQTGTSGGTMVVAAAAAAGANGNVGLVSGNNKQRSPTSTSRHHQHQPPTASDRFGGSGSQLSVKSTGSSRTTPIANSSSSISTTPRNSNDSVRHRHNSSSSFSRQHPHHQPTPIRHSNPHKVPKNIRHDSCCLVM